MQYFLDSSALAKLYHPEAGSRRVEEIFYQPASKIAISRLTGVEILSVFAIKVRSGAIGISEAEELGLLFRAHLTAGSLRMFDLTEDHYARAENLVIRYGFRHRLRSLDALQLAVALGLEEQGVVDQLVASDNTLCEVARAEGMLVLNPS